MTATTKRTSYDEWLTGDALAIGRALMERLPQRVQVARGVAVLEICRSHLPAVPAVEYVLGIGGDSSKWKKGHDAFGQVRALTLLEERTRTTDLYRSLLYLAEIVAKIIYNASGSSAPFDHDSPWWLARNARDFATHLGEEPVRRAIWTALGGNQ